MLSSVQSRSLSGKLSRKAAAELYGMTAGATVNKVSKEETDRVRPMPDAWESDEVWMDETVRDVELREMA